jgi:MoaA/NifB/PqqE/SkfB family radical SAM enzyme
MTPKDILTNKAFCPIPWTGFYADVSGDIKNCICSYESIGNLKTQSITEILTGAKNTEIKTAILNKEKHPSCNYCYRLEENKKSHDIVSSRIYYLKELKTVALDTYSDPNNFNLHQVDVRWSNVCNHACVYCGPVLSSKWADELKIKIEHPSQDRNKEFKDFIFSNISELKNIYMAGGEPLLMKENEEFLTKLLEKNPDVSLRVNTNLSKTNTRVLDLICKFKNVHWTVSVESMGEQFEYMRYGGKWEDFLENLNTIKQLPHKLTFNMTWGVLNYLSIFDTVDYFIINGFHQNSFILTALLGPRWLDTRHLPKHVLQSLEELLLERIAMKQGFLLEDGYRNLLKHIQQPFDKNFNETLDKIAEIDARRNLDSTKIFTHLYQLKGN